jgi:hypothetical protein
MGRPPIGKVAMTSTERVHKFRAKHRPETKRSETRSAAAVAKLEARIRELEAELARERQRREINKRHAAKPKAEKPPLPPDEARERTIKGLRTRIRNLEAEWSALHMPRATQNKVATVLHPDKRKHASEVDKDEAYKLFNAWKSDRDRAYRTTKS